MSLGSRGTDRPLSAVPRYNTRTIVVHGASTAYGYYDAQYHGWANRLNLELLPGNMADQMRQVFIDNRARPGLTIGSILRTADTDFATHKSIGGVAAVLSVGINESKIMPGLTKPVVMPGLFATQLERYSAIAAAREVRTVFVGPQPVSEAVLVSRHTGATIDRDVTGEYAEAMRLEAQAAGMPYIDAYELFGDPAAEGYIAPDGVHPTALGHAALHQAISTALRDTRFL